MTIMHHPSDLTLSALAAGSLDPACAFVVSTHVSTCEACRNAVRSFERLRGVALEDAEQAPMAADALRRAMNSLASDAPPPVRRPLPRAELPSPLSSYPLGAWRWIGPGVHWQPLALPSMQGTRVFMLKAAPGTRIPHHEHGGIEWTSVLQGAFRHQYGRYGAGDFDEADETVEHHPVVEDEGECICLVALQGQIRLKSWIGRLVQPFVRI
jgi:putative transcriptional regulator